jgi:phage/plasmid-like protein (TIGR03299 family)
MSHLIDHIAYAGATPWHTLGSQLPSNQPIEVWAEKAGMNWEIKDTPVCFQPDDSKRQQVLPFQDQRVLYRSDNLQPLSVVGSRYQVVQPMEVLEFYRDLTEVSGFQLETAGVLKGGKKFWALARTGQSMTIKGNDQVNGYVLLATSCDGTLATTATPTTVRVVCSNTLSIALRDMSQGVRVSHSTAFDAQAVKSRLGIAVSQWDEFMHRMKALSERKVKLKESEEFFSKLFQIRADPTKPVDGPGHERAVKKLLQLYGGHGRGAEMGAAKNTAWGLLCAVTEFVDHERRARSTDHRLDSAWFGQGALLKQRALESSLQLIT